MGLIFTFTALVCWGFGDFLIQKCTRKFGDWLSLFYIAAFVTLGLLPFIYQNLISSFHHPLKLFLLLLLDLEALKLGKISVVEPIYAFEISVTAALSVFVIKESLSGGQILLIGSLLIGIILLSIKNFSDLKNVKLEKGIWYAISATVFMGIVNVIFGIGARTTDPLLINWVTSLIMAIAALIYLINKKQTKKIISEFKKNKALILKTVIIDNLAWIAFAYSTLYIPIAITTSISEGYIGLAAGLGLIFNKEKLKAHQFVGLIVVIASVIVLAKITTGL
jgi:uncharacterized membrane protein